MLTMNLQRFAGDKTERATERRRRDAREQGNIPKSPELTSALGFLAAVMGLRVFGPMMWNGFITVFSTQLSHLSIHPMTKNAVHTTMLSLVAEIVRLAGPTILVVLCVGVGVGYAQVGAVFLPTMLRPQFNRISPIAGVQRLFSLRSTVEAMKSLLKLTVVAAVTYLSVHTVVAQITSTTDQSILVLPPLVGSIVFRLALEIGTLMLGLAAADLLWQRFEFERGIRMSKQEIKDERKQQEGDPQVKSNIRRRGYALAFRRMMQAVPEADVVVTNPTHFAVALQYKAGSMSAPIVIAKGQDQMAMRIRQAATKSSVPLVENKPLAQSLYKNVEIGQYVPKELYAAVAEVLAYVYRLQNAQ